MRRWLLVLVLLTAVLGVLPGCAILLGIDDDCDGPHHRHHHHHRPPPHHHRVSHR